MPSINTALSLKPSAQKVLAHLYRRGSISPIEAQVSYGLTRLAAAVHVLRAAGYTIRTDLKKDEAGHSYARYRMQQTLRGSR
jgi:hypothetical protein